MVESIAEPLPRPRGPIMLGIGLLAGIALAHDIGLGPWLGIYQIAGLAAAAILTTIPGTRQMIARGIDRVRDPSPRARTWIALGSATVACAYLQLTARLQGYPLYPKWHDEYQFLLQARMLAHGRLWMPALPLPDFFDTFYVLVRPVYAAQSFPGAALLNVPGVWLGLQSWVMPLLAASTCVGLVYWIITELVDGAAGLMSVILLLSLTMFRMTALMVLAQVPVLMLGLAATACWLQWRSTRRYGWAAALGAASGWAAITRPLDALCFVIPIGIAMLLDLNQIPARRRWPTLGIVALAAFPFLALQLVFDRGVTGHWLQTPFSYYNERQMPGLTLGFNPVPPDSKPQTPILQKRLFYETIFRPAINAHSFRRTIADLLRYDASGIGTDMHPVGRIPTAFFYTTCNPLLLALLPVGLWGLAGAGRRVAGRWVLVAPLPLLVGSYILYPVYWHHYTIVAASAVVALIAMALGEFARLRGQWRSVCLVAGYLAMLAVIVPTFPELGGPSPDQKLSSATLKFVNDILPDAVKAPAVLLVKFVSKDDPQIEPVYNIDTPWPDDAPMIKAHDLGWPKNQEIINYYAAHQPQRNFYELDRATNQVRFLGTAADLASSGRPVP